MGYRVTVWTEWNSVRDRIDVSRPGAGAKRGQMVHFYQVASDISIDLLEWDLAYLAPGFVVLQTILSDPRIPFDPVDIYYPSSTLLEQACNRRRQLIRVTRHSNQSSHKFLDPGYVELEDCVLLVEARCYPPHRCHLDSRW